MKFLFGIITAIALMIPMVCFAGDTVDNDIIFQFPIPCDSCKDGFFWQRGTYKLPEFCNLGEAIWVFYPISSVETMMWLYICTDDDWVRLR